MSVCGQSLFGGDNNYIKVGNGSFVAIEGSMTAEKLDLSDLRIPYKQLLKGKVIIKKGTEDYLLNHLGLGDNATFLAIKVSYNPKSVIEEDNYLSWSYLNDTTSVNHINRLMVLTGNSTHRIPQLYITNPNEKYDVQLDVMVAVIDDQQFFEYEPTVYFTNKVDLPNSQFNNNYNTSLGDKFQSTIEVSSYPYALPMADLITELIDFVKDTNGIDMIVPDADYILLDVDGVDVSTTGITATVATTYTLKFDITDSSMNSVSDDKEIKIIIKDA